MDRDVPTVEVEARIPRHGVAQAPGLVISDEPTRPAGYVDFFGYHALAGGWFFVGWMYRREMDSEPENPVGLFTQGELAGGYLSLTFSRGDVSDESVGFLFFIQARVEDGLGTLDRLLVHYDGAAAALFPVQNEALPEMQLRRRLQSVFIWCDDSPRRRQLELLAASSDATGHGFIEYIGYHAGAGGWLVGGWVSQGWTGEGPHRAQLGFRDGETVGDADAMLYPRHELPDGAAGLLIFVRTPATLLGPVVSLRFDVGGAQTLLDPIDLVPQLREAELLTRLRANLGHARPSRQTERFLNLLNRRPYNGQDTLTALAPDITLYVDEAILCPPGGVMLIGWAVYRPEDVVSIRLRCGDKSARVALDRGVRISRHDVLPGFEKFGFDNPDCGFMVYVPDIAEPYEHVYLEVEISRLEVGYRKLEISTRAGTSAIKRILETVDLRAGDTQALYDRVLGPAVEALNRERLKERPAARVVEYGAVPKMPRFSVIVPLYGRLDFVEYQLALFSAHPGCAQVEFVYVLDDPPKRPEALALFKSVYQRFGIPFRAVLLEQNVGFAPANNIGLSHAHGTYIAYLNSDVFPGTLDWLERLAATLEADATLGAVGPLLLYEDGAVQHRGMYFERLAEFGDWFFCQHLGKGLRFGADDKVRRFLSITGACMVMRRELAMRLGGFDESYVIGDFEDSDLCLKIQALGLFCAVDPAVRLYHLERKSQNFAAHHWRMNLTAYNAWQHERRWGGAIEAAQAEGEFAVADLLAPVPLHG